MFSLIKRLEERVKNTFFPPVGLQHSTPIIFFTNKHSHLIPFDCISGKILNRIWHSLELHACNTDDACAPWHERTGEPVWLGLISQLCLVSRSACNLSDCWQDYQSDIVARLPPKKKKEAAGRPKSTEAYGELGYSVWWFGTGPPSPPPQLTHFRNQQLEPFEWSMSSFKIVISTMSQCQHVCTNIRKPKYKKKMIGWACPRCHYTH